MHCKQSDYRRRLVGYYTRAWCVCWMILSEDSIRRPLNTILVISQTQFPASLLTRLLTRRMSFDVASDRGLCLCVMHPRSSVDVINKSTWSSHSSSSSRHRSAVGQTSSSAAGHVTATSGSGQSTASEMTSLRRHSATRLSFKVIALTDVPQFIPLHFRWDEMRWDDKLVRFH